MPLPAARPLALVALAALTTACNMGPVEPSLLAGPRVLAVQSTPRSLTAGQPHELTALVWDADDAALTWQACPAPWIPDQELTCPAAALPVGAGNPLTLVAPEGVARLWLRLDGPEALGLVPAIRELGAFGDAPNPTVLAVETPDGPLPATLKAGETLEVLARLEDPVGAGLVTTFFTSGGSFEPWRTRDDEVTLLTAPKTPGTLTLIAVTRDAAAGVGWQELTLEVVP